MRTSYCAVTVLLKSLSSGKFSFSASFHAFSAKNVSTLTPRTFAPTLFRSDAESRNLHISVVHTLLNAAGKKARTTGPLFSCSLSFTGSRSSFGSSKSGALVPT